MSEPEGGTHNQRAGPEGRPECLTRGTDLKAGAEDRARGSDPKVGTEGRTQGRTRRPNPGTESRT